MAKKETITVKGTEITLFAKANEDYISLTDMAKLRMPKFLQRLFRIG